MKRKDFLKNWNYRQAANVVIFTNMYNVHIELDIESGRYLNGNLRENIETKKLFSDLLKTYKRIVYAK